MFVTIVKVYVKPGNIDDFISATRENHKGSLKEKGNLRFDLLRSETDPSVFFLYEVCETKEAAAAHKNTPHYAKWKDTVAPWMAKPREGFPCNSILPKDLKEWKNKCAE